ncbi:uncharacterized protein [Glycine max]|uniref:uncharacterized protein isoform X2 n=1 Tax=Glycine max TaxID=3847 RepID=UPI001B35602A|nr:uncharacterized protein LOC100776349 [Glycine max]
MLARTYHGWRFKAERSKRKSGMEDWDFWTRGQQLDVATRLTSSQSNSSLFYFSFEIEDKKVALYLNYGLMGYAHSPILVHVFSFWQMKTKVVLIAVEESQEGFAMDCKCAAALYFGNASTDEAECYLYRLVLGLKQVEKGTGFSYMVKVPKGTVKSHERHNVKRWVLIVAGGVDGLIVLLLVGGFGYWLVKRRSYSLHSRAGTT